MRVYLCIYIRTRGKRRVEACSKFLLTQLYKERSLFKLPRKRGGTSYCTPFGQKRRASAAGNSPVPLRLHSRLRRPRAAPRTTSRATTRKRWSRPMPLTSLLQIDLILHQIRQQTSRQPPKMQPTKRKAATDPQHRTTALKSLQKSANLALATTTTLAPTTAVMRRKTAFSQQIHWLATTATPVLSAISVPHRLVKAAIWPPATTTTCAPRIRATHLRAAYSSRTQLLAATTMLAPLATPVPPAFVNPAAPSFVTMATAALLTVATPKLVVYSPPIQPLAPTTMPVRSATFAQRPNASVAKCCPATMAMRVPMTPAHLQPAVLPCQMRQPVRTPTRAPRTTPVKAALARPAAKHAAKSR